MTQNKKRRWSPGRFNSLQKKLSFWFLTLALIPLLILGVVAFLAARDALTKQAFAQLEAAEVTKTNQINAWLAARRGDILFARNLVVVKGSEGVNEGLPVLSRFKDEPTHPDYLEAFSRAQEVLDHFVRDVGGEGGLYQDIMLVDREGDVVFALESNSVRTNIFETGEVSPLLFESGLNRVYIGDMRGNPVHGDEIYLNIAAPVLGEYGLIRGVLILQAQAQPISAIMNERTGLGESGETYLVGPDKLFRNDSRFFETTLLNPEFVVDTVAVRSGLTGEHDTQVINDYRGVPVLSSWGRIEVQAPTPENPDGLYWAIVAEIDQVEVNKPVTQLAAITGGLALLAGLIVIGITVSVSRGLANPLVHVAGVARAVAGGDLSRRAEVETNDEIEQMAGAFNDMTAEIDRSLATVAERTRRLEIIAELSERLSAILDFDQLLAEMVELVKERFDYYHAHVYIIDEATQRLIMTAGAGQAGAEMKAAGHSIALAAPTSLVARAARTSQVVRVDNVRLAEDWLPNRLLPDTYAEMAVPIVLEGQVVGVLDVQEDQVAGLDDSDASLLRSLANQVAVAIRNARQFAQVSAALAEARAVQAQYLHQAWDEFKSRRVAVSYQDHRSGLAPLSQVQLNEVARATGSAAGAVVVAAGSGSALSGPAMAAPLKLQNEMIGTIQIYETDQERQWSEQELALLQAIADQVAQTAETLRLVEETQEQAGEEQLMREITDKLRASTSLEALVKTAAEELSRALDTGHSVVKVGLAPPPAAGPSLEREPNGSSDAHREVE